MGWFLDSLHTIKVLFWNLATFEKSDSVGQLVHEDNETCFSFSIGYESVTDTYKIVAFRKKLDRKSIAEVKIIDLFGDGEWRNIENFSSVLIYSDLYGDPNTHVGSYVLGFIHWLSVLVSETYTEIVALDMDLEQFFTVGTPEPFLHRTCPHSPHLIVLLDRLCFSYTSDDSFFNMWVLRDRANEIWERLIRVHLDIIEVFENLPLIPIYLLEKESTVLIYNKREYQPFMFNWLTGLVGITRSVVRHIQIYEQGVIWVLAWEYRITLVRVRHPLML